MNLDFNLGKLIAIIGFIFILLDAIDYLLGWTNISAGVMVIGLILVVIGMFINKKSKKD
ncbi:MAG: hypothetical protein PHG05_04640 [Candidatus Nanoarchaeia archaeon]|nr:hypothetical protein [Candidatus Nanoarchaeia archaeon]